MRIKSIKYTCDKCKVSFLDTGKQPKDEYGKRITEYIVFYTGAHLCGRCGNMMRSTINWEEE